MSSIFDKLGVLLRSKVGGLADDIGSSFNMGGNRNPVDKLRKQINSAVGYEEDIQKQINGLEAEIDDLNQQVDQAVGQGQDATARHLLATLQRREQHLTLLRGDLETHQMMLNELILQVNHLDAVMSEQAQAPQSPSVDAQETPSSPSSYETSASSSADLQSRVEKFQQVVDESQARISELGEKIKAKRDTQSIDQEQQQEEDVVVDDELEKRRNRLMKR